MGRRSINTTKSGKYMNPTDQARKEARKKELKKNKRQRQMVRAAVLKNKDPAQILEEMEKIDEMEYNVLQPSPLNEKVLRDKRKKLKETFDRVMRLYHNDEPEHWSELKRKEVEYEKKRLKKQQYYESVKHAQSVQIDEIPLPSATQAPPSGGGSISFPGPNRLPPPPTALSLPPFAPGAPPGILKKPNENLAKPAEKSTETKKDPPGVPPGPPPDLDEMPELDTDAEDDEVVLKEYNPKTKSTKKLPSKPNALQQRILGISGQNIDEFMKEMENVHRRKEQEREAGKRSNPKRTADDDNEEDDGSTKSDDNDEYDAAGDDDSEAVDSDADSDTSQTTRRQRREEALSSSTSSMPAATTTTTSSASVSTSLNTSAPLAIPPPIAPTAPALPHMQIPAPPMPPVTGLTPPMLFRPPPMRPPGGMPNFAMRMPPGPPPGPRPPPGLGMPPRMGIRMPPGPPPGLPPRMPHHHKNPAAQHNKDMSKGVTTIMAKPQIRNLSADVTRFVPSTLRVKREEGRKPNRMKPYIQESSNTTAEANRAATKDDAYLQFMNEMQGLL